MTTTHVHERLRTASDAVPKPVVALVFAAGAWLIAGALWLGCVRTLSLLGL